MLIDGKTPYLNRIGVNPKSEEAWELLVTTWWAMGEKDLSTQAAVTLIRINPNHPLGKIYRQELKKLHKETK